MRFLGHQMRMDKNRLLKRFFIAYVRGGALPPTGSLLMDCQNEPLSVLEIAAHDRAEWNRRINNLESYFRTLALCECIKEIHTYIHKIDVNYTLQKP